MGTRAVGAGVGGAEEEGAEVEASDGPRALALQVPRKVIMGSSEFQQFFLMYAKLMAGLRDSKVRESNMTPLAQMERQDNVFIYENGKSTTKHKECK